MPIREKVILTQWTSQRNNIYYSAVYTSPRHLIMTTLFFDVYLTFFYVQHIFYFFPKLNKLRIITRMVFNSVPGESRWLGWLHLLFSRFEKKSKIFDEPATWWRKCHGLGRDYIEWADWIVDSRYDIAQMTIYNCLKKPQTEDDCKNGKQFVHFSITSQRKKS